MSPTLPDRPHPEHLKKQAREKLAELRGENADATLAEAQHAVAKDYGFASWRAMKAKVDRLRAADDLQAAHDETLRAAERDGVHNGTPAGWAHHFSKASAHEVLQRAEQAAAEEGGAKR